MKITKFLSCFQPITVKQDQAAPDEDQMQKPTCQLCGGRKGGMIHGDIYNTIILEIQVMCPKQRIFSMGTCYSAKCKDLIYFTWQAEYTPLTCSISQKNILHFVKNCF